MLRTLPQPVLAAVVLVAVAGLVKVSVLQRLWRVDRTEFIVAAAALIGVLGQGLLRGVLIGCVISLIMLLRRASTPHVAFLGRIPGSRRFSDSARHPDNEPVPGMLLFRVEASILYFNADHVCDAVLDQVRASPTPPRLVVADLSSSPHVDLTGAEMLASLHGELAKQGISLQLVETRASVRDTLRMEGLEDKVGGINRFSTVADCVDQFNPATA
jgi:MFS superfamily sulfate permease-like transporter